jgi:hypothetical protein
MSTMADAAAVAQVLDRRSTLELADVVTELFLNTPTRSAVRGWIEEGTLQARHGTIDGALAPTRHAGKGILGGTTKSDTIRRG